MVYVAPLKQHRPIFLRPIFLYHWGENEAPSFQSDFLTRDLDLLLKQRLLGDHMARVTIPLQDNVWTKEFLPEEPTLVDN